MNSKEGVRSDSEQESLAFVVFVSILFAMISLFGAIMWFSQGGTVIATVLTCFFFGLAVFPFHLTQLVKTRLLREIKAALPLSAEAPAAPASSPKQ